MMIDIDFNGRKNVSSGIGKIQTRSLGPINATPKIRVLKRTEAEIRQQIRMAERNVDANTLRRDLNAAMSALESANSDIDRLNSEVSALNEEIARLNAELQAERAKNARMGMGKKQGRHRKSEAVAEAAADNTEASVPSEA